MITIRKASSEDSSAIIDFQKQMAWETEQLNLVPEIISNGVNAVIKNPALGQYYIAENDGKTVASLLITYEWSDWRNADVWWFQSVYVIPDFRRKGIFKSMYSFIKNEAARQGVAGLRLYVESQNKRAKLTYESLGMSSEHYTMYELLLKK